jgi:hypothetical protein
MSTVLKSVIAIFPGNWSGAGGLVHSYQSAIHRQAAEWYCRKHMLEHGVLPEGTHTFQVSHGIGRGFDVQTPIGRNSGIATVTMTFQSSDDPTPTPVGLTYPVLVKQRVVIEAGHSPAG